MKFSDETWDKFFDWISGADEDLSDSEVDARLAELGIDVSEAFQRVLRALREAKAIQLPELDPEERRAMSALGSDFVKRLLNGERPLGSPGP